MSSPDEQIILPRAFAVACDAGYFPGLRALLNSIAAYHDARIPVFLYQRGLSEDQLAELRRHPAGVTLFALSELPFPSPGMWEVKQQIFAHCIGRARCVYLLDADLVLVSALDDVFELAEAGKIASSSDGSNVKYDSAYAAYSPDLVGTSQPYVNSGALCVDVMRHWDLAGLWAFASKFGAYSPGGGAPLGLPGHGDQGVFNAVAGMMRKVADFHVLPEGTWCDSSKGCVLRLRRRLEDGRIEVWNETDNAPQRLVHSSGPKWWTVEGQNHLRKFGDKLKCFEHFNTWPEVFQTKVHGDHAVESVVPVKEKVKILIGICSCVSAAARRAGVRQTWVTRLPKGVAAVFFVGQGALPTEDNMVQLPVKDDYPSLPQKVQAFCRYALEHFDFDYLFKCDDDTYVHAERLLALPTEGAGFIGSDAWAGNGYASGGAGYLLSPKAAGIVANAPTPGNGPEDVWVGRLLHKAGIPLRPTAKLQMDHRDWPRLENDCVTAHWCPPELMKIIHQHLPEKGSAEVVAEFSGIHAAWRSRVKLLRNGVFVGGGASPDGRWAFEGGGTVLVLSWFHWPKDILEQTSFGFLNSALRLEAPSNLRLSAANGDNCTLPSDKLHVGCGSNMIPGWLNHDMDLDIRGSLPFPDQSIRFVFGEHVVEHITPTEAFGFFREVRRVLKPGGAMRIIVPCVDLIHERYDEEYGQFLRSKIGGDGSLESSIQSIIVNWEHKAVWTTKALQAILEALGFKTVSLAPRESCFPEMVGIDGHAAAIGGHANWVESGVVEAVKWHDQPTNGGGKYPPLQKIPACQ